MARKRKGLPVHGWFNIDKPAGISSSSVVGRVRRSTGAAKVGHGGTLDPLATGVLPVALGEATKTVSYAMDGTKVYRFNLCFGSATATDDTEGEVVEAIVLSIEAERERISLGIKQLEADAFNDFVSLNPSLLFQAQSTSLPREPPHGCVLLGLCKCRSRSTVSDPNASSHSQTSSMRSPGAPTNNGKVHSSVPSLVYVTVYSPD